jgi:methylated-DNA-protein-cysteine methyltransferase-like protein
MTQEIIEIIRNIPQGKVATYGQIARLAGYNNGARQVVRILHTCTEKHSLPWHRVINAKGEIALSIYNGADEQKALLEAEGIKFLDEFRLDLKKYQWAGN